MAEEGSILPGYVQREFEDYLKCGRLEHKLLPAKVAAGSRHAWWLEFSRNDRRERAILGVSAGISQI